MVSFHSFYLSLVFCVSFVCAAPWVVTEFYEAVPYTRRYLGETTTTTTIREIVPTITDLPDALSTITSTGTAYYESDVTIVQQLFPSGVGTRAYNYAVEDDAADSTVYVVNMTYTAPTGCSTQWTTVTPVEVTPPYQVAKYLPTTAVSTSTSVNNERPFQPTTYTYRYVWVEPTQIPEASLSSYSRYSRPTSLYQGSGCQYGENNNYYPYNNGDDGGDEEDWINDSYYMGISPLALILILVLGWIGLWLILGFIEAWVRFRRLMLGWQTHRGLPVCWAFTIMPFTLFFLCFLRKRGHQARTAADAAILKQKWNDMSSWTRLRLFFIWGFRFKYPYVLGPEPPRLSPSKRPGQIPGQPPLISQPGNPVPQPGSLMNPAGQAPRGPSPAQGGAAAPEMSGASNDIPQQPSNAPSQPSTSTPEPHAAGPAPPSPEAPPHGQDEIGRAR